MTGTQYGTQYAVKLRRGRLNYVGGEISPETDLRYTKIFETFCELQLFVFFVREYSPEADLRYTKIFETFCELQLFVFLNISWKPI
jgi:hypothetical protein